MFDTNVVLDLLMDRKPYVDAAATLFALVDEGRIDGLLCATTVTTVHYITAKGFGAKKAQAAGVVQRWIHQPVAPAQATCEASTRYDSRRPASANDAGSPIAARAIGR